VYFVIKKIFILFCLILLFSQIEAKDKLLRWKFQKNDKLYIKKFAEQNIKINRRKFKRYVHHYGYLDLLRIDKKNGYQFKGRFRSQFRLKNDEKIPYKSEEKYNSLFYIKPTGEIIKSKYYMPNVRSIPSFPLNKDPFSKNKKSKMKVGDTWILPAIELMNYSKIIKIPLDVHYEYRGAKIIKTKNNKLKKLHKILINYQINYSVIKKYDFRMPNKIFGYCSSILLWDEKEGIPYYIYDDYNLIVLFPTGESHEFKIKGKSFYYKLKKNKKINYTKLKNNLSKNIKKIQKYEKNKKNKELVVETKKYIKINLPDVLFEYNSSILTSKSKDILKFISKILIKHKEMKILVKGYTDNIGSYSFNKRLSENRAKTVVNYFIQEGNIKAENLSFEGRGARDSIASNNTKKGRQKNRRVEIIIIKQ